MEYASLIAEFGANYGLGDLTPDENGAVGFEADGRSVIIQQQSDTGNAFAMVELVETPENGEDVVNRLLMQANQALFVQDGMALVLNHENNRYCLLMRFEPAMLDFLGFDARLSRLLDRAEQWRTFLENFFAVASKADAAASVDASAWLPKDLPLASLIRV